MPRQFLNHEIVDSIVRLTGETATVFGWDEAQADFVRMTTTIVDENGERIVGTTLGQSSAAYAAMMEGRPYFGEAVIVGRPYYTAISPFSTPRARRLACFMSAWTRRVSSPWSMAC
jgi:methyl-accepting chemotaxis protein